MPLSPLLLKSLFGCVSVAGVGTAASFQIYQTYNNPKLDNTDTSSNNDTNDDSGKPADTKATPDTDKSSENGTSPTPLPSSKDTPPVAINPVVLVKAKTSLTTESQLTVNTANENYKCQLADNTSSLDFCRLVKLDFTNNWIDVNGIKKAQSTTSISLTDLNDATNYYKLEINEPLYGKVVLTENKQIEIISTKQGNKTLAKLSVSFKAKDNEVDYVSTQHLLGRLETAPESIDSSTKHQCFWTTSTTADSAKGCSIFSFGSTMTTLSGARYHRQNASDLLKAVSTGTLTQHHNFIIEHEASLTKTDIAAQKTLYLKKLDNSTLSGNGKLENLVPVIMQGTTDKKAFILSETPSYSIIVKKSTTLESSKSISHTNSTKNYKCKFSSVAFDCDLVDLPLSDSKTSMNVADIKNADLTTDLSVPQAESPIKFFKLDVPLANFQTIKTSLNTVPPAVELIEITDGADKIVEVAPIFAIDDDNVPYFHKSTFLVKAAVISGDGAFDASKTHYCSFSTTNTSDSNPAKCQLIDLGASDISPSTNIVDASATTSIATANNYLVKFIDESNKPTSVSQDTKGANNMLFLQEDAADSTKKLVAKFANEHIQPVLLVEGESSKKHLFILS